MINKKDRIRKIRNNWVFISKKLNFEIVCPFIFSYDGKEKKVFAFLPTYGSKNGMIIDLIFPPEFIIDNEVTDWAKKNGYYYSYINVERYLNYDEEFFIETLEDWGNYKELG